MSKAQRIIIIASLLAGLLVRFYKLTAPVLDWHSFRQVDTLAVSRSFLESGLDLLHPRYPNISPDQSGKENPQGFRMVEFPIYNLFSFITAKVSSLPIDISSRLVSIFLSLSSAFLIFLIIFSQTRLFFPAYLSMLSFLFLPYSIFYSRAILSENTAVFFMLLSILLFKKYPLWASLALSLSILAKPFTLLISAPLFLYLFLRYPKRSQLFILLAPIPLLLWRRWITNFPQGIPVSAWLLNFSDNKIFPEWYRGYHIDFLNQILILRPYWWRWLVLERTTLLILGAFGLIPLFLGLIYRKNRIDQFNLFGLVGIFLYFLFVPGGNIQHDYYQILIIPSLSFCLGCGFYYLYHFTFKNKITSTIWSIVITFFILFFAGEKVLPFYKINRPQIVTAGQEVQKLTPKNSLIIAPNLGDTTLLYYTGRSGFPIEIYDIEKYQRMYPDHPLYLVSLNLDTYTNSIAQKYKTILKNDQFIILDLNQ